VDTKLINDLVRIDVLEEEIKYYKSLVQEQDTGFIYTTISFLESRIENIKGNHNEWPFR